MAIDLAEFRGRTAMEIPMYLSFFFKWATGNNLGLGQFVSLPWASISKLWGKGDCKQINFKVLSSSTFWFLRSFYDSIPMYLSWVF